MSTASTTTLFDLNKTAFAAAVTAVGTDGYTTEEDKLMAFNAAGHDHRDFTVWASFFTTHTATFNTQRNTPAPSAADDAHAGKT